MVLKSIFSKSYETTSGKFLEMCLCSCFFNSLIKKVFIIKDTRAIALRCAYTFVQNKWTENIHACSIKML